jgi:hypothetical protein
MSVEKKEKKGLGKVLALLEKGVLGHDTGFPPSQSRYATMQSHDV